MSNIRGFALPGGLAGSDGDIDAGALCGLELTRTQRFWGFATCFLAGFVISFLATFFLLSGQVAAFAVLYSLGNIVALLSTMFLVGPKRQVKMMFDKTRVYATCVYLVLLALTLILGLVWGNFIIIILVFAQWVALIWYSASYIPFARDAIRACVTRVFGVSS
ncbi:hypothetical protein SeLEV6574_g01412 [Synchytrium endobioticum]|nr:hypothetical protein SeLEV6574_g01412 [Synchytrium endobioticum]